MTVPVTTSCRKLFFGLSHEGCSGAAFARAYGMREIQHGQMTRIQARARMWIACGWSLPLARASA